MAFSLRNFIKKGLLLAVGQKPSYEIILVAANWLDKGVLLEEDLAEVENEIDTKYLVKDDELTTDEVVEE